MSNKASTRRIWNQWLSILAGLSLCFSLSGCSYMLLLGLLIGGPPTVEPEFDKQTKESMTDKDISVAVVCFAPTEVRYSFENIDHEVAKYVTFRLMEHKIVTIPPDRVKAWDDFDEVKLDLPHRFADRIDAQAQKLGLAKGDDYVNQLRWGDEQERVGAPGEIAAAVRKELEDASP